MTFGQLAPHQPKLLRKRGLVALLVLSSACHVSVVVFCLFLTVPYVILAFPGHTHIPFLP